MECIFLGYNDETKGYTLMQKSDDKIILSRDVTFLESNMSQNDLPSLTPTDMEVPTNESLLLDPKFLEVIPTNTEDPPTPPLEGL